MLWQHCTVVQVPSGTSSSTRLCCYSISGLLLMLFSVYIFSVCPVNCGSGCNFFFFGGGWVDRMDPRICSVNGGVYHPMGTGNFTGGYRVVHCNQWEICGITAREHVNQQSCLLRWWVGSSQAGCVRWASRLSVAKKQFSGIWCPHIIHQQGVVTMGFSNRFMIKKHINSCEKSWYDFCLDNLSM